MTLPMIACGFYLLLAVLIMCFGFIGLRDQSYLSNVTEDGATFRKPLPLRLGPIMLGTLFLSLTFVFTTQPSLFAFFSIISISISGGMFWLARPEELRFDLKTGTYRRTVGWPLFIHNRVGGCDEIYGVYVGMLYRSSVPTFHVGVRWRSKRDKMTIGQFSQWEAAQRLAEEVSTSLDLQIVMPPPIYARYVQE